MKAFKNYFKFPLTDLSGIYIMTADGWNIFNWCCELSDKTRQEIIDKINGTLNKKSEKEWTVKNDKIYYDDKLVLLVRGWGMLTGNGGCGFTEKTALILQNDLIKYVVEQLNR